MFIYRRIRLRTGKDYAIAEKLKTNGWRLIELGCYDALFEKKVN